MYDTRGTDALMMAEAEREELENQLRRGMGETVPTHLFVGDDGQKMMMVHKAGGWCRGPMSSDKVNRNPAKRKTTTIKLKKMSNSKKISTTN